MDNRAATAILLTALTIAAMAVTISDVMAAKLQIAESRWSRPPLKHEEQKSGVPEPSAKRTTPERAIPGSEIERQRPTPGEATGAEANSRPTQPAKEVGRLSPEEWKIERERLRAQISDRMEIKRATSPDDIDRAALKDDPTTFMYFRKRNANLDIDQISTRELGKGSGSVFASEALRKTGTTPEKVIRLRNLIEKETVSELAAGKPPAETKMGKFGAAVAEDLGRKVEKVTVEDQISDFGNRTTNKDMIITLQ